MRTWVAASAIGALSLALVVATVMVVDRGRQLEAQADQIAALEARITELESEVAELERRSTVGGLAGDALGGLLGEQLGGTLGELIDGLLDGGVGGVLDELLEGFEGFEGFGGLDAWREGLGDPSALGRAGFSRSAVPGARCLLPAGGQAGGLEMLLGTGPAGGAGAHPSDGDPQDLVADLMAQVAAERDLAWRADVEVSFLTTAEVTARLTDLLAEPPGGAAASTREQRLLTALRAIPPGTDLAATERELLTAGVAGFYVPDTGELVVRVPDDGRLRALDRITLAHELDHALTDQVHGLPELTEPPYDSDPDAAFAMLALIEGDATLLMHRWALAHVGLLEQLTELGDPDMAAADAAFAAAPYHVQQSLLAPYTDGLDWVCDRWLEGGWAAVDAAYAAPPTTSAEVLFGTPMEPLAPAALTGPAGATSLGTTTFGAAPLAWLFEAPGGDVGRGLDRPRERAAAWAGGAATVWTTDTTSIVALALVAAGHPGGPTLCDSLTAWFDAAAPGANQVPSSATTAWALPDAASVTDGGAERQRVQDPGAEPAGAEPAGAALWCEDAEVTFVVAPALSVAESVATSASSD